jgi:hypothetical protein
MGAVRRTNAGWRQTVRPFSSVGWHHGSKVVAPELIKYLREADLCNTVWPTQCLGYCRLPQQRPTWMWQHDSVPAHAGGSIGTAATTYAVPTALQ